MVLNTLTQALFEPLESVHINLIYLKKLLLLALASAKQVGELYALSVHQACLNVTKRIFTLRIAHFFNCYKWDSLFHAEHSGVFSAES